MDVSAQPALACVYTIHHTDGLHEAERKGGAVWTEAKTWRSASALLTRSQEEGTWLSIFFAAADRASGLLYVARLDRIDLERTNIEYTRYSFSNIMRIAHEPPISTLRLLETGEPLSSAFIRPYALCHTPMELLNSLVN